MKLRMNTTVKMLTFAATLVVGTSAFAQAAGQWAVKVGANKITPVVNSGDLDAPALPHTKVEVGNDTEPVVIVTYGVTDHISVEIPLGLPYKHDLNGAGAIEGTGKLGSSKVLPATALVQYRFFDPKATIRPYVGAGLTYAYFSDETGSGQLTALINTGGPAATFKLDRKFGATFQTGFAYAINDRWFADLSVTKSFLKTTAHYSTGQTQNVKLDPVSLGFGIGYKF